MKKLFLLIPVLALSMIAGATKQTISPSSEDSDSNIRSALSGSADTIILNAGNYKEKDQIHFRRTVVIMAAEGADVTITPTYYCDLDYANTKVKIIGIKFDGTVSGQQAIRVYDANAGKELRLENCEFKNFAKEVISGDNSTYPLDSCIINNCYFHNNKKSAIYFTKSTVDGVQTCYGLIVKNSTFANIDVNESAEHYASVIDVNTYDYSNVVASDVKVLVDHCTFYNYLTYNTDHCAVRVRRATNTTVSNCIFAHPTEQERRSTYCYNGLITNCLSYNLTKNTSSYTHASTSDNTITNCGIANPLFVDATNGDFSFPSNWVTMSISPACGNATDGTALGDPRWYSTETLPSVNFASPYQFVGAKAQIIGNIWYDGTNKYLYYDNKSECGVATWKINATKACILEATLNMNAATTNGHKFKVEILDADGNSVGETAEPSQVSTAGDITLPNQITLPAAGKYTVKLYNLTSWSTAKLDGVTFSYVGGDVQDMPGTTDIADAWFSSNGTRADGKISYSSISSGCWAKWNIAVASAGTYNVTVNISGQYGHKYVVEFLKEGESTPIVVTKGETNYDNDATLYANELGSVALEAANYEMKVFNDVGDAALHSVTLVYSGGAVVNIPNNNIPLTEAILADGATRDGDGLHFKNAQYVKWNIHATEGLYTFTAHCTSPSTEDYSNLMIKVKQGNTELYSYAPQYHYNQADNEIQSPAWLLDAGDYTLELSNPTSGNGYLTSLAATAPSNMFILDDNKTDDGSIAAAAEAGTSYKFLLKRSFTAGRYYTICIPVGSWNDELKLAFGADYELWKMTSAEQNGDAIDLNFDQINGQSFHAGWPYIIKPSVDVQNPVLYNEKTIANSTYNNTQSFTAADFVGTFYKDEIPAGENNLYLQNNNLYYSESSNTTIKGTRAWIRLKQQGAAPARARIVMGGKVATDINLVNGELVNGTVKAIENGQLILIRDGKKYNVMGARLQ